MRVGILTFHRASSYGAVLQAYALRTYLNSLGYETEIIDYRNKYFETLYHSNKINLGKYKQFENEFGVKQKVKRILEVFYMQILQRKFDSFQRKYLNINTKGKGYSQEQLDRLVDDYDYFITGSDQVWNHRLTDCDYTYFLNFASHNQKVSFAASIGGYPIENDNISVNLLKEFKAISVRENQTKENLRLAGIENIFVHLDPVFLLQKEKWNSIVHTRMDKNYILLFEVGRNKQLLKLAMKYAEEHGKKLYYLSTDCVRKSFIRTKNIFFAGPEEFLTWIKYSDYVFTNSFHATAFSILLNKNFYCHLNAGQKSNDRLSNLLELFGLNENADREKIGGIDSNNDISSAVENNLREVKKYFDYYLSN